VIFEDLKAAIVAIQRNANANTCQRSVPIDQAKSHVFWAATPSPAELR